MKKFNLDDFVTQTTYGYYHDNHGQRLGQYFYNEFRRKHPDVMIPNYADCFYDCKKLSDFLLFLSNI